MLVDFTPEAIQAALEERMRTAPPKEQRRTLCLWLCNQERFSTREIAALLGMKFRAVQRLRGSLRKDPRRVLYQTHGGNRKTLSRTQELVLFLDFVTKQGSLASLRAAYEAQLGKPVSDVEFKEFCLSFDLENIYR